MTQEYMRLRELAGIEKKRQEKEGKPSPPVTENKPTVSSNNYSIPDTTKETRKLITQKQQQQEKARGILTGQDQKAAAGISYLQQINPQSAAQQRQSIQDEIVKRSAEIELLSDFQRKQQFLDSRKYILNNPEAYGLDKSKFDEKAYKDYVDQLENDLGTTKQYYSVILSDELLPFIEKKNGGLIINVSDAKAAGVSDDLLYNAQVSPVDIAKANRLIQSQKTTEDVNRLSKEVSFNSESITGYTERDYVTLPDGVSIKKDDLETIKKTNPEYYAVATEKGYGPYIQKFKEDNTQLPDGNWISTKQLDDISKKSSFAAEIIKNKGVDTYNDKYTKAIEILEPYKNTITGKSTNINLGSVTSESDIQTPTAYSIKTPGKVTETYELGSIISIANRGSTFTDSDLPKWIQPKTQQELEEYNNDLLDSIQLLFDKVTIQKAVDNYVEYSGNYDIYKKLPYIYPAYYSGKAEPPRSKLEELTQAGIPVAGTIAGAGTGLSSAIPALGAAVGATAIEIDQMNKLGEALGNYPTLQRTVVTNTLPLTKVTFTQTPDITIKETFPNDSNNKLFQEQFPIESQVSIFQEIFPTEASMKSFHETFTTGSQNASFQESFPLNTEKITNILTSSASLVKSKDDLEEIIKTIYPKAETSTPMKDWISDSAIESLRRLDEAVGEAYVQGEIDSSELKAYQSARERFIVNRENTTAAAASFISNYSIRNYSDEQFRQIVSIAVSNGLINLTDSAKNLSLSLSKLVSMMNKGSIRPFTETDITTATNIKTAEKVLPKTQTIEKESTKVSENELENTSNLTQTMGVTSIQETTTILPDMPTQKDIVNIEQEIETPKELEKVNDLTDITDLTTTQYKSLKRPDKKSTDEEKREFIKKSKGAVAWPQGELKSGKVFHVVVDSGQGYSEATHLTLTGEIPDGVKMYRGPKEAYKSLTQLSGKPPVNPVTLEGGAIDPVLYRNDNNETAIVFRQDKQYRKSKRPKGKAKQSSIAPDVVEITRRGRRKRRVRK